MKKIEAYKLSDGRIVEDANEAAIQFKGKLTDGAYYLLNKLILDLCSRLNQSQRVYKKSQNASLIYNLLKGNYQYSDRQYKEIFDCLNISILSNETTKTE